MSMGDLAESLSRAYRLNLPVPIPLAWGPDRPVFDSTGLAGRWTFTMDYGIALLSGDARDVLPIANAVKALGLSLKPVEHPLETIAVDHVERVSTEN
jgi:uncharacterized protein (TIGR03435 family)